VMPVFIGSSPSTMTFEYAPIVTRAKLAVKVLWTDADGHFVN